MQGMSADSDGYAVERERLVRRIASHANISDARVLEAFRVTPRHLFVPEAQRAFSYEDRALPIGEGQTISQPSMIAIMLQAIECGPGHRALEVGGGSGYAAALLSHIASVVHAVELKPALAQRARITLAEAGIENVVVHVGDGSKGLPSEAPFDRILVSAGATSLPEELVRQLAPGGVIAIPVGDEFGQTLLVGRRDGQGEVQWRHDVPCMFVPLVIEG
jgi:protein-L-isoaspartate(D-aspartate) O-methyltransferase